jgi:ADP-heptose:LPS heptosyltransferase
VDRATDFESLGLGTLFTGGAAGAAPSVLGAAGRVVCWFGSRDPVFARNLGGLSPGAVVAAPAASDLPVWQHLCQTVGAPLDGLTSRIMVPETAREAGRKVLAGAGWDGVTPFLLLHPGAGGDPKRWPVQGFAAVAAAVSRPPAVVVHQGPADAAAAAALIAALGGDAIVLVEPPLPALAGALAAAALYVGNDSGVSHLAASVGAPSALLYTRRLLAWRPWAPEARLMEVSAAGLIAAEVAAVIDAAREVLAGGRGSHEAPA